MTTTKNSNLQEIINESVTRTLARTTLTSLTTFFVVFTLFMFGGEIIHPFAFTLLIGIIVGTYSSLYIASPITFDTIRRREVKEETKAVEEEKKKQEKLKEQENFDLILLDVNMPEMNGLELVKKVRAEEKYADMPIIMVTTEGGKAEVITALKAGVNNYIVKPFSADILKEKLDGLVKG